MNLNFRLLFCFAFVITCTILSAQPPSWADASYRKLKFGEREYIVGYASEVNTQKENPAELLKRLENYAKGQIAEYIQVTVRSEALLSVDESNNRFEQTFSSIKHSASNMVLSGLKTETHYDQKGKTGYSLVYTKRSDLLSYYQNDLNAKLAESERRIALSRSAQSSNAEQAYSHALEALALIPEIEHAQTIIFALKRSEFEQDIQFDRVSKLKTSIDEAMRNAQKGSANTLDDACFFLAQGLKIKTGAIKSPVVLSNFTYQDTRVGSELSNRIHRSLESRLVSVAGYSVVPSGERTADHILTGTYWKEANEIKLIATLRETSGKILASAEAILPISWLEANSIGYLPENFENAYSRMKVFQTNEIVKGDLNIEVWTNKGDDNLIFVEGERLKFYVRANKECYLRFVYHLADNQSVLLLDSYYIPSNMANKVVELPDEFECTEPFGVETLQVNAQTKPFEKLKTRDQYGYKFIEEPLNEVILSTRGFKKVEPETIDRAEKRIIFTTLKK
ncbi:MAG TPA: DUF4384 domain-containing protein [Salinivirgaceae bacterium]|nr:DUF4384 domain-containing protein [Salinivirgaceae bacterium]